MYLLFVLVVSIKVTYRWVLLIYYVSYINWLAGYSYRTIFFFFQHVTEQFKKEKIQRGEGEGETEWYTTFVPSFIPPIEETRKEKIRDSSSWSSLLLRKRSLTASLV